VPSRERIVAQITARAWLDPVFKARLLADPAAVMREHGIDVPADVRLVMHENTAAERHLVLPQKPDGLTPETRDPLSFVPLGTYYHFDKPRRRRGGRQGGKKGGSKRGGRKGGSKRGRKGGGGRKRTR
jgi:uncharacterized membrane protein YgcG